MKKAKNYEKLKKQIIKDNQNVTQKIYEEKTYSEKKTKNYKKEYKPNLWGLNEKD